MGCTDEPFTGYHWDVVIPNCAKTDHEIRHDLGLRWGLYRCDCGEFVEVDNAKVHWSKATR